jgi:hypothetical protein
MVAKSSPWSSHKIENNVYNSEAVIHADKSLRSFDH